LEPSSFFPFLLLLLDAMETQPEEAVFPWHLSANVATKSRPAKYIVLAPL